MIDLVRCQSAVARTSCRTKSYGFITLVTERSPFRGATVHPDPTPCCPKDHRHRSYDLRRRYHQEHSRACVRGGVDRRRKDSLNGPACIILLAVGSQETRQSDWRWLAMRHWPRIFAHRVGGEVETQMTMSEFASAPRLNLGRHANTLGRSASTSIHPQCCERDASQANQRPMIACSEPVLLGGTMKRDGWLQLGLFGRFAQSTKKHANKSLCPGSLSR